MGLANVDISPELAVRLSMAWASTFEKGATITTSRDTSRAARVLKRAIMVGCNAAGVNVDDLEAATVPVTRFQITSSASMAGVTVGWLPTTPSRWCSASSTKRASTSTRPPSARSSGSTTARTSDGCWPGRSATSGSRPGRSSTTPPP